MLGSELASHETGVDAGCRGFGRLTAARTITANVNILRLLCTELEHLIDLGTLSPSGIKW